MLNTFELNEQILQTFRNVPSALVPYAQGYERTRIPLNKIKAVVKLPEKLLNSRNSENVIAL